jgi:hypothetical protein
MKACSCSISVLPDNPADNPAGLVPAGGLDPPVDCLDHFEQRTFGTEGREARHVASKNNDEMAARTAITPK